MSNAVLTQEEIPRTGLAALRAALGAVGMVRFLQMFETGRGDYTAERDQWLDGVSLDEIVAGANAIDRPGAPR